MTMQTEADVKQLQADVKDLQENMMRVINAITALIEARDVAVIEGDDITVKASPNGQGKSRKTHR